MPASPTKIHSTRGSTGKPPRASPAAALEASSPKMNDPSWRRSRDAISRLSELIAIVESSAPASSGASRRSPTAAQSSKRSPGRGAGTAGSMLPSVRAKAESPMSDYGATDGAASPLPSPQRPTAATPGGRRPSNAHTVAVAPPSLSPNALAATAASPQRVTPMSESCLSMSPNRSVDKITGSRPPGIAVLPRAPRAIESPHDVASSPQRAATFVHNHLAPWDKPSTWRALRTDQVDAVSREAHENLSPSRRAPSREAREVQDIAQRAASGSVPGTFFARMILRSAPQDAADHRGGHTQAMSRRRQVDGW